MAYNSKFTGANIDSILTTAPIANGGTGATTAAQARINLGIAAIYYGTEEPSPSLGNNGDIYILYRE